MFVVMYAKEDAIKGVLLATTLAVSNAPTGSASWPVGKSVSLVSSLALTAASTTNAQCYALKFVIESLANFHARKSYLAATTVSDSAERSAPQFAELRDAQNTKNKLFKSGSATNHPQTRNSYFLRTVDTSLSPKPFKSILIPVSKKEAILSTPIAPSAKQQSGIAIGTRAS